MRILGAAGTRARAFGVVWVLGGLILSGCMAQPAVTTVADAAVIPTSAPAAAALPAPTLASAPAVVALTAAPAPVEPLAIETAPTMEPVTATPASSRPAAAATKAPQGYRIEIARLGIDLPVAEGDIRRDVDQERTPEFYAFHLPGTSLFTAGNTYLYAHARVGMFKSLWNARVGDLVVARTPNGTREYVVAEVHPRVPPTDIAWAGPTADTRLTLQTSTGPNSNDPRFVVVARPR